MTAPIETKVAATGLAGVVVTTVFGVVQWLDPHGFTSPPAYVTAGLVTIVGAVVGWLVPHTVRPSSSGIILQPQMHRSGWSPPVATTTGAAAGPPTSPPAERTQP